MYRRSPFAIFQLFSLIAPPNPSRTDLVLMYAGRLAGTLAFTSILMSLHYGDNAHSSIKDVANAISQVSVLTYFALLIPYGIRYLGSAEGVVGFSNQAKHVFKVLFLYMFLPAIMITILLVVLAIAMGKARG